MINLTERVTELTLVPEGEPIFAEGAIVVRIEDEAAGEFITIGNAGAEDPLRIDIAEWPAVRDAIDKMCKECRL